MRAVTTFFLVILAGCMVTAILFGASLAGSGQQPMGVVENIDGIPFVEEGDALYITETLAHADIYLTEAVVFKTLELIITFDPQQLRTLAVGIRGDSFWLSYPKQQIYVVGRDAPGVQTVHVHVPLTDRFQEIDRSIDMMFFAQVGAEDAIDQGINDTTAWTLYSLEAHVRPAWPTYAQLKDYIRSVLYRERAA